MDQKFFYWEVFENKIHSNYLEHQWLHIENKGLGGMTRINWAKNFINAKNARYPWLFNIYAYHIKNNQKADDRRQEFIEVDFKENDSEFQPFKFIYLVPMKDSYPKQLFFYKNYNFRTTAYNSPTKFLHSYYFPLYDSSVINFIENGVSYTLSPSADDINYPYFDFSTLTV